MGSWDNGPSAIERFKRTHKCNKICRKLGFKKLEPISGLKLSMWLLFLVQTMHPSVITQLWMTKKPPLNALLPLHLLFFLSNIYLPMSTDIFSTISSANYGLSFAYPHQLIVLLQSITARSLISNWKIIFRLVETSFSIKHCLGVEALLGTHSKHSGEWAQQLQGSCKQSRPSPQNHRAHRNQ